MIKENSQKLSDLAEQFFQNFGFHDGLFMMASLLLGHLSLKGGLMSFVLVLKLNVQLFPYLTFLKQGIISELEL